MPSHVSGNTKTAILDVTEDPFWGFLAIRSNLSSTPQNHEFLSVFRYMGLRPVPLWIRGVSCKNIFSIISTSGYSIWSRMIL